MARKPVAKRSSSTGIGAPEKAIEDLVKGILKEITGSAPKSVNAEAERFFFPHGVELIEIGATVGPKNTPIFEFKLKIAGAAGKLQASGLETALQEVVSGSDKPLR